MLQTLVFLAAFFFAPKHGMLAARRRARQALEAGAMSMLDTLLAAVPVRVHAATR